MLSGAQSDSQENRNEENLIFFLLQIFHSTLNGEVLIIIAYI